MHVMTTNDPFDKSPDSLYSYQCRVQYVILQDILDVDSYSKYETITMRTCPAITGYIEALISNTHVCVFVPVGV